jgi:hypothetical protein
MTSSTRYFVISSALVTFVGIGSGLVAYYGGNPARAFTGRGGPDELQFVPSDAALVAYADVRHIMSSELRQRIKSVMPGGAPNGQLEFENQTGINVETDIDHVVAYIEPGAQSGSEPNGGLVLARGLFNEVKIESLMRDHGAQVDTYRDKRVIIATAPARQRNRTSSSSPETTAPSNTPPPQKELAVSFLQPGLVAIGTPALVHRAIDLQNGGDNITNNDQVADLIRSLDSGTVWAVGRLDTLRQTAKLPRGMGDLPAITWFSASGTINDGIDGVVRAETSSDDAAKNLRDVIQGFVGLASLQSSSKPELKSLVESLQISGSGKTVALSFSVPGRLLDSLSPGAKAKQPEAQAH